MLVENKHGHGAIKKKYDVRDRKTSNLAMAPQPFYWSKGFDIEQIVGLIPTKNQGQSSSCGGQAASYYMAVLQAVKTGKLSIESAKDPYCFIFYPGGGTTTRDIGRQVTVTGIRSEALVPSYDNGNPPNEWFMEDKTRSNAAAPIFFKADAYAFVKTDIESIASAIRDNYGCILMVHGENNGSWISSFPKPPQANNGGWNHFLYAGKAKMINGVRYIGVKNSWGDDVGEHGWQWLSEDYFKGMVKDALVFYDKAATPIIQTVPQKILTSWFPQWVITMTNWLGNYLH